ncbi:MAG TPA: hypothetical protein DDX39_06100 [Bacteroidales bacterium]|nr:MAG: hypothetical protein A2W98_07365 [Bacteroidetes bacterium GWF2_33_38]HBF88198.1 hypothetical protein [Bacteroidales bacterium]
MRFSPYFISFSVLFFLASVVFGQDTITVMQYNLLGYTSDNYITCNETNNNIDDKDAYIETIFHYVKPDIFTVNEISANSSDHQRIVDNCLNTNGLTTFQKATMTNYAGSELVNQLYYNSDKFSIALQDVILDDLRDINVYKLKYFENDVDNNPIYLYCIVAHLKAGNYDNEDVERAEMTGKIMSYLDNLNSYNNILVMGDFNLYTSSEVAYQNMINHSNPDIKMNDPVDQAGSWSSNSSYASIHTQSTHTADNDCASTGGLDDRFDFILASNSIMHNTNKFAYVVDSYKAVGQDGLHYNSALSSSPTNSSVPSDVLNALYNNSDHLPVTLKLKVNTTTGVDDLLSNSGLNIQYINPCNNELKLYISTDNISKNDVRFELYSVLGQKLICKDLIVNNNKNYFGIDVSKIHAGTYFMHFVDEKNNRTTKKLIIR